VTEYIVKRWPRFDNYLALFTTKLGKPAQRHFIAILIALIIFDGRKNIAGLNRALFAPCHASSLARFIGEVEWDENDFEQTRLAHFNRQLQRYLQTQTAKGQTVPAFLCIDDTNNPKSGRQTPFASYQYSHLAGGLIRCYCLVTALVVIGPYTIPLTFRLYRKKADCVKAGKAQSYISKTELAAQLIQSWQPPDGVEPYVLVDSWYVCDEVFKACTKRNFTLIGAIATNRLVLPPTLKRLTALSEFASTIEKTAYQRVKLEKQTFELAGAQVQLKGGQNVKLVVGRALLAGTNPKAGIKRYTYRCFVSSDPHMSVSRLAEFYSIRWETLAFHRLIKELLGLDHNQCWRERNVRRMWTLVLIAYSYLLLEQIEHYSEYVKAERTMRCSLGQVVSWHKREAHRGEAEWIYQQAQAGRPLAELLDQLAA
jgi:hypothetical protein